MDDETTIVPDQKKKMEKDDYTKNCISQYLDC